MKNVNTASQITVYERYVFHDWAAGRIKFDRGPDLARGPDFGHACLKASDESIQQHLNERDIQWHCPSSVCIVTSVV